MRPTLPPTRECRYVPLDRPAPRLPARVDLVGAIQKVFFSEHPEKFRLTVRNRRKELDR